VVADINLVCQKKETWLTHLFIAMGVPGDVRVSGVPPSPLGLRRGKQVSGKRNREAETSAFVIWNF